MRLTPAVIIGVLSDSTEAFDRGEKFHRSRLWLPSLTDYLLVSHNRPVIEHYHRLDGGRWKWFSVEDLEASLPLPSSGCGLPLAEVYDRVTFPPEETEAEEEPPKSEAEA